MAHVLLVDDDPDFVAMNKAVLEQRKHTVSAAYSAREAEEALRTLKPDVCVVDVMMETRNAGFDLARALRDKHPTMPVVMLTGVRREMKVRFKLEPDDTWLPVSVFLEKPVPPTTLAETIEGLVAGKKA